MKERQLPLTNPNFSAHIYHPQEGLLILNPDQVDAYLAEGWATTPFPKVKEKDKGNDAMELALSSAKKELASLKKSQKESSNEKQKG